MPAKRRLAKDNSTLFPAGSYPDQVVVADFNSDGKLDLTVPDFDAGTNQVLLGDGQGGFGTPISSPGGGGHVAAGDYNSDGKMDLAVVTTDLKILLGNGAGGFTVGNSYSFGPGNPTNVATADFNHNGTLDLAVAVINAEPQVYTFLGNGMGGSSHRHRPGTPTPGELWRSISMATATSMSSRRIMVTTRCPLRRAMAAGVSQRSRAISCRGIRCLRFRLTKRRATLMKMVCRIWSPPTTGRAAPRWR